jgi:hypothetical protein
MKLDILIPTMPSRKVFLAELLALLEKQIAECPEPQNIGIITNDSTTISIGEKRGALIHRSRADYICMIDDDDSVCDGYVKMVYVAARDYSPDTIGIRVKYSWNGQHKAIFEHSIEHRKLWPWTMHELRRSTHHLCPTKRSIAAQVPWTTKNWGEDYDYARRVMPHLETEVQLGGEWHYHYRYVPK